VKFHEPLNRRKSLDTLPRSARSIAGVFSLALGIAIVASTLAGCSDNSARSEAAAPSAPAATKTVAPAPMVTAPTAPAGNNVLSVLTVEHEVDVTAQRDGVVTNLMKDEGNSVSAGQEMGKLDERTIQTELVKARDDLQVDENNRNYKAAELKAKSSALHRQHQLRDNGLSTDADLETAEFEAKAAEYDLKGFEALVESGHAEINRLNLELEQTQIKAPFSGVVVRRYIREGQAVNKGDKTFRVTQLAPLQVQFQVPETAGWRPTIGAPVKLTLVGDADRSLTAHVLKISPTIDAASDSYDVLAQLGGKGPGAGAGSGVSTGDLRPGMAVRVSWPSKTERESAAAPAKKP
jgi:RND family efflux transporter MFP subunit